MISQLPAQQAACSCLSYDWIKPCPYTPLVILPAPAQPARLSRYNVRPVDRCAPCRSPSPQLARVSQSLCVLAEMCSSWVFLLWGLLSVDGWQPLVASCFRVAVLMAGGGEASRSQVWLCCWLVGCAVFVLPFRGMCLAQCGMHASASQHIVLGVH